MDNKKFSAFIFERRNELKLSQNDIANYLSYSSQLIYNWEKGKSLPELSSLSGLCNILKITIDELINSECKNEYKNKYDNFNIHSFSENLKKIRTINSLTQKEVANKVGVSYATVIAWEKGNSTPSISQFILLKELFNVTYENLYYGDFLKSISNNKKHPKKALYSLVGISLLSLFLVGGHFVYKSISHNNLGINNSINEDNSHNEDKDQIVIVRFYNYDNSLLLSKEYEKGSSYVYTGETPLHPSDDLYVYTFDQFIETNKEDVNDLDNYDKEVIYYKATFISNLINNSEDVYTYSEIEGGISITGVTTSNKNIVIPNKIDDKDVLMISSNAFKNNTDIESVIISEGITSIGVNAFYRCNKLTNIKLPKTLVDIGAFAFSYCEALTEVEIPSGVSEINEELFANCLNLENLILHEGITVIGKNFIDGTKIKHISLPTSLVTVKSGAFFTDSLQEIVFPESVETIERSAFYISILKYVIIPKNIKNFYLGSYYFNNGFGNIFYKGSPSDFALINLGGYELDYSDTKNLRFYSDAPISGYWHYVDNVPVIYE